MLPAPTLPSPRPHIAATTNGRADAPPVTAAPTDDVVSKAPEKTEETDAVAAPVVGLLSADFSSIPQPPSGPTMELTADAYERSLCAARIRGDAILEKMNRYHDREWRGENPLKPPAMSLAAIGRRILSRRARYPPHAFDPIGEAVQDSDDARSKLLWHAAGQGGLEDVQRLADSGGLVAQPDNHGATPLWIAAFNGHLEVVQWLAGNGGSVTQPDTEGATPLFVAAQEGHLAVVQWLVSHGLAPVPTQPDPTSTDGFLDSPLNVALHNDDGLMWRWLLDHMRAHGITGTVRTQLPGSDASPTPVWPSGGDAVGAAG